MSIAFGAVVAACTLALTAIAYAVRISMHAGRLETRVNHLESAAGDNRDVRDLVIKMGAQMDHMSATITKLSEELVWMTKSAPLYGPPSPAAVAAPRSRSRKPS